MVSHWSLSDNKPPQVSKTLLRILAVLSNAVVWMVSTCPLISKSSSHFIILLGIVPSVLITVGFLVTFIFHSFCYFFVLFFCLFFCLFCFIYLFFFCFCFLALLHGLFYLSFRSILILF